MRALSLSAPRHAQVIEVADPCPREGEVVVRIRACGVCGSDLNAWRGVPGMEYPLAPGAPGHETLGEVVARGRGVDSLQVGQQVTGVLSNGFAELGVAQAADLLPVPPHLADVLFVGEPLACAMNVVRRAAPGSGQRIAVVGFGYLAALIIQFLPADAGSWVAVSRRVDSRRLALHLGAQAAYDFEHVPSQLWDGFPVVFEVAGVQQALDYATWLTACGGRLVIAGYHADGTRSINMQSWNWKGIDAINAHERRSAVYVNGLRAAFELVRTRPIDLASLHTHTWSLDRAAEAFQAALERPPGFVKGIVCP